MRFQEARRAERTEPLQSSTKNEPKSTTRKTDAAQPATTGDEQQQPTTTGNETTEESNSEEEPESEFEAVYRGTLSDRATPAAIIS